MSDEKNVQSHPINYGHIVALRGFVCRQSPSRVCKLREFIPSRQSRSNISISFADTCYPAWNQAEPWLTWELIAAL